MRVAWVIGSGGLLGSALCRSLQISGIELFLPSGRLPWGDTEKLAQQLSETVDAFAARASGADSWEIYWAAGIGTMRSPADELAPETQILGKLLGMIDRESRLTAMPGGIAFASSAGALYAGSNEYLITEDTPVAPTTAYGREKLKQEEMLRTFAATKPGLRLLIARISTIYGPGQAHGKQQGLLAHIARCIVRNEPIQIFVPFDTIRDYIPADDAACRLILGLNPLGARPAVTLRIVAAEQPKTIAEITATFKKMTRRSPRIVTSASRLSSLYSRRILFRSLHAEERHLWPRTSMLIGIAQLMAAERAAYTQGNRRNA